jgi:hypothetical protein
MLGIKGQFALASNAGQLKSQLTRRDEELTS